PFETQSLSPIMTSVYLDYNASTPIATPVASSLDVFLREHYGNPSSNHWAGKPAKFALEIARKRVADLLGAEPHEIVFTSGGSESNNLALKG
ncbi:aminotransferase class V-fold PLP-dependent enzyme, partial [Escherichia coli]|uniref:aminotransferase class V-fold PLP-dependent enzyme n=1 Tax=Escherichia coli TaxID=562 RepID=UPI00321C1874